MIFERGPTMEGKVIPESPKTPAKGGRAHEKLAITLPTALAQAKARHARSLSAFIAEAVEEKIEKDDLDRVLDEIFADEPMTEAERDWAYGLLTRK